MDEKVSKEVIEDALNKFGIDVHFEQFKNECRYLASLVHEHRMSPEQALATVKNEQLREEVRVMMYVSLIGGILQVAKEEQWITEEQLDDYTEFLTALHDDSRK